MRLERGQSFDVEHWSFEKALKEGHSQLGLPGMYVDIAVIRGANEEVVRAISVRSLKVEWERYRSNEGYKNSVLQQAKTLMDEINS